MKAVWALRSAVFTLWMLLTVLPVAVAILLGSIVLRGPALYRLAVFWLRLAMFGWRWICGVRHRVQGLQHLRAAAQARSGLVLASKHQSTWETFAYPVLMPRPLCYVFKKELLLIPFFGWAMGRLDMIHIDRSRRAEAWARVAEQGRRLMAQGNWVIMFPEGTRTVRGAQGSYKAGAARLAVQTGAPIVPIAVASARCWPRRSFLVRPGVVDVSIGPPIAAAARDPQELMQAVEAWIEAEMRRIDADAYR